jgi:integrase
MGKLTARRVERMRRPGRYGDGGTLFLVVTEHKGRIRRQWVQRLVIQGTRRDMGLGGFPFVSLTEARDLALDNRRIARKGGDPRALMESGKVPTVAEAARATLEAHSKRWAASTAAHWLPVLEAHAGAIWGRAVDSVSKTDVIAVLKAAGKNADKVKMRLRQVFAWAVGYGFVDTNPVPVNGELKAVMPTERREVKHHKAMDWRAVPEFFRSLPTTAAGQCLRLLIVCGLRQNEARNLRWSDIDTDARMLTIDADRMKSRREFRQPLTTAARAVLDAMPRRGDLVFPSERTGRALSDVALQGLAKKAGVTCHGFRSSFSTWGADNSHDETVIEHCLHHLTGNSVSRSYNRSEYIDRRRAIMDAWAAHVLAG